jgi:hypothetical protein
MSSGHIDTLGMIHELKFIADIAIRQCPVYEMKNPYKTGGNG